VRNPPILVSVIGFFGMLAGVSWLVFGFALLGFDWFGAFGDLPRFEPAGLWGWLNIGVGVIWVATSVGLWTLRPWAWVTTMVVAGLALFEAFLWFLESPGSGLGIGMSIMPVIIMLYLNSAGVKEAFGLDEGVAAR
jgi:hypothetical protein